MKNRFVWLGILLIMVGVFAIGCYTVLMHPQVQGEEEATIDHTGEYYRQHCTDCHGDYHNYPYGYFYGYYPDYYWSSPRWGHYYAYPWWWDTYWSNNDNGVESVPKSDEKAERRRGLEPPYVPQQSGTPAPFIVVPPSESEEQPVQIGGEEKPKTPTEQKKEEKPKDKKAEKRRKE
jgi:hypothetical protein